MLTVDERWSLTDIPAATKTTTGFDEKFKRISQAMMLPPPAPILAATTAATQILASAQNYQSNASTFRLGNTVTPSPSNRNLPKVNSILKERQQVRLVQKGDHMISVIASLWKVEGSSKEKLVRLFSQSPKSTSLILVKVNNTSVKLRFPETDLCSKVVSHLFDRIKDSLSCGPTPSCVYLGKSLEL